VGGQQLLSEERVAPRARQDVSDQRRRGRLAEDPVEQLGQLAAAEPAKLQPQVRPPSSPS
jgi:hypothetical protein